MRSVKTTKIETAARARIQPANDDATIERMLQAMTAFMAASAADETAPAQRAA